MSKQSPITSFFTPQQPQQPQRPLPFTSPPRHGDDNDHGDGFAVMTHSQSPGVIVPGTPPTPFSEAQSVSPRSVSPVLGSTHHDRKTAFEQLGLSTQFPPPPSGPTISPTSGTKQDFDAAAQFASAQQLKADAQRLQDAQNAQKRLQDDLAREAASKGHTVFTQFKGGRRKSKKSKMAKKSRKTKSKSVKRSHRLKKKLKLKSTRK